MFSSDLGKHGEQLAKRFLEKRGFEFLERNFKTPRWGEIDLVMEDGETLVFVEVKTRSGGSAELFGGPLGAIDPHKIETLKRAGQFYLSSKGLLDRPVRIDGVTVILESKQNPQFDYFRALS